MYRRIPIGMAVLASALVLAHQALAIEWVDYGEVWAPDTGMISLPCVVVDPDRFGEAGSAPAIAPLYKMYYSDGIYPECDAVHLATSTDGLSWSFVGAVVSQAKKPVVVYSAQGFGQGDAKYRMWFTTAGHEESRHQTSSFKMCESVDGLNWTAPLSCVDADVEMPLLASGNSVAEANAWNRGSYGVLSVLFNPDGAAAIDPDTPMNNRFVMYYNVYGIDPVSEEEGGPAVSSSVAMAVSADGVAWLRIGEAPVLRGIPSVTGGMVSFADVVNNAGQYVMCFMAESHPAEGYLRQVGKAVSTDGVHWAVVVKDIAALQAVDENKGTYGLALAVDPNLGTLQMWRAVGDGAGALTIRYAREE